MHLYIAFGYWQVFMKSIKGLVDLCCHEKKEILLLTNNGLTGGEKTVGEL